MLVISRKQGQSLILHLPDGSLVQVMVASAGYGPPRIGVQAQDSIRVSRMDVHKVIPKHDLGPANEKGGE